MAFKRERPPAFAEGEVYEGDVCRTIHPVYGWGYYAVEDNEFDLEKPLHWVDDAPDDKEDGAGHWIYAKDVS